MEPLAALLSLALAGGLAQSPHTADRLTEERFLAALSNEAVIAAASREVGERRAALAAAGLYDDPEIALGAEDPGGDDQEIELTAGCGTSRPVTECQVCGCKDLIESLYLGGLPPVNTRPETGSTPV